MSLQAFYGARNGRKQLSHKRKSIIYLLYYLDLSTGFRLGGCIQNQIYFIDSKYLHCSNNFCSCANLLTLQSQILNRHLIGLYWIVFVFHQIMKGSARKEEPSFYSPTPQYFTLYRLLRRLQGTCWDKKYNHIVYFITLNKYYCRMQVTIFLQYSS